MKTTRLYKGLAILLTMVLLMAFASGCKKNPDASNPGSSDPSSNPNPPQTGVLPVEKEHFGPKAETPSFEATADNSTGLSAADGDRTGAFQQAIEKIGQKGYIYLASGTYLIGSNLTIPADVVLVCNRGVSLSISAGVTLEINGFVEADAYQIFTGEGTVSGTIRSAGYPQWFGGSNSRKDDSAGFQKAVDVLKYMYLPSSGTYHLGDIRLTHPITIDGRGGHKANLVHVAGSEHLFSIESSEVALMNLSITGNSSADSVACYFNNTASALSKITLSRINTTYSGTVVANAKGATNKITDVHMITVRIDASRNTGFYMTAFDTGIEMHDTLVNDLPSTTVDFPLYYIENCNGLYMANVDAAGGADKGKGADGFYFKNCKNVVVDRSMVDYTNGFGLVMIDCSKVKINNWVNSLCQEGCYYLENVTDSTFDLLNSNGNGTTPTIDEFDANFVVKSCSGVTFNSLFTQGHCGDGVHVIDSQKIVFNNLVVCGMAGNGYMESGTSDNNQVNGLVVRDIGGTTSVQQVGASSKISGAVLNDKTYAEALSGPSQK